ncbi:MAG: hypothetical protein ACAH59_01125 [Pseudobdellovibrionaceae bacterium]
MEVVKLLERKGVIRSFGVCLILAPLFNTFLLVWLMPQAADKWTLATFWSVFSSGVLFQRVLDVASVFIGCFLLTGTIQAWGWVLAFLGGYITMQITYMGKNFRTNPFSILFFLINIGIFLFIADQLVWKQKRDQKKKSQQKAPQFPLPKLQASANAEAPRTFELSPTDKVDLQPATKKPLSFRSHSKMIVHFKDFGPWAQLTSISSAGIEVRSTGEIPPQIESRKLEIQLGKDLRLRAQFLHRHGPHFFFEYDKLPQDQIKQLNAWLSRQAG